MFKTKAAVPQDDGFHHKLVINSSCTSFYGIGQHGNANRVCRGSVAAYVPDAWLVFPRRGAIRSDNTLASLQCLGHDQPEIVAQRRQAQHIAPAPIQLSTGSSQTGLSSLPEQHVILPLKIPQFMVLSPCENPQYSGISIGNRRRSCRGRCHDVVCRGFAQMQCNACLAQ